MYLTREDIVEVLKNMQSFESDLNTVYQSRGYDFRTNTGRRNALISVSQESETAKILRKKFEEVIEDGAPGKPDIYIKDIDTELECKLTSGSKSKGSRVYALQTDWETLCNKGQLDYLYIVANKEFDEFCVLFFEGLTSDDFFPPANGSRGKSRMNKTNAMQKCTCLVGDFITHNDMNLNKINTLSMKEFDDHQKKIRILWDQYESAPPGDAKIKSMLINEQKKETLRHRKKVAELAKRASYWNNSVKRYKFIFEKV